MLRGAGVEAATIVAACPARRTSELSMRFILLPVLLVAASAQAQVYRGIDSAGRIIFSDRRSPDAEQVELPATVTEAAFADDSTKVAAAKPDSRLPGTLRGIRHHLPRRWAA